MNTLIKLIQPQGSFDARKGEQIYQQILEILAANYKTIVIDFQKISFMDSSGFCNLILILKTIQHQKGRLVLCSINAQIKMIFEITGTTEVFEVFQDQDSFAQTINLLQKSGKT